MPVETIGDRLRRYRRLRGLSQRRLAELAGVSRQFVAELERNAVTIPREPANIKELARVLGVAMRDLAGPTGWYDDEKAPAGEDWRTLMMSDDRLTDEGKRFLDRQITLEFEARRRELEDQRKRDEEQGPDHTKRTG